MDRNYFSGENWRRYEKTSGNHFRKRFLVMVVNAGNAGNDGAQSLCGALDTEYEVLGVDGGVGGLDMAQKILPHLVVCDMDVTGMSGTAICRALKKDPKTRAIPFILVMGKKPGPLSARAFRCGADDCLIRPFKPETLKRRVKKQLYQRWLPGLRVSEGTLTGTQWQGGNDPLHPDEIFIRDVYSLIRQNLADPFFSVADLCDGLCMARASMYRKIQALTGLSPQLLIRSYRLVWAAQLLRNGVGSVTEICFKVGFTSTAYFTKCFKAKFKLLPKQVAGRK